MTITRKDIIDQVSESLKGKKRIIADVVNVLFDAMRDQLIDGNRIEIRGFGTLTVKETNAWSNARNPRTGEHIQVPPYRKVRFVPGQLIKGALRTQRGA